MNIKVKYALLDGAFIAFDLNKAKQINQSFYCLYRASSEENLADVAPYLFTFSDNPPFMNWFFENGWGNAWGVLVDTKVSFEDCWKHFRKFLLVKTEDGQELYFRFYDPRVLKIFLPTCDEKQIIEFFGPVEKFIVEGETKDDAIEFSHQNGVLKQKIISATEVFGNMESINA